MRKDVRNGEIIVGDAIENLGKLEESPELIFADPPYNISGNALEWKDNQTGGDWSMVDEDWDKLEEKEYFEFTKEWIKRAYSLQEEGGNIFVCSSYHNIDIIQMALRLAGYETRNIITWKKTNAMPNMTKRTLTHSTEFIIWATKGTNWTFNYELSKEINPKSKRDGTNKQMRDVWELPLCQGKERLSGDDGKALHPTQKPEELLRRIILIFSNEEDLVLDPFLGTGTTAVIADEYDREWLGIELEEEYVEVAEERIKSGSQISTNGESLDTFIE